MTKSACDLRGFCHQFGSIPHSLELLRHWELPLFKKKENKNKVSVRTAAHMERISSAFISVTHVIALSFRYHDVHLRALGTDNVTADRVLTQVDLAALGLVDGNGGNCSQNLQKDMPHLLTGFFWAL